jgi:hypothetical protein
MKIFLSYRRDDTGGRAGRLFDVLVARFGASNVFQDVSSATPGFDFADRVEQAIATSDAVLVVIGPSWLDSTTADGQRRIDQPDDFVRHELTSALASGMPVVPVLVDDAELPPADRLPEDVRGLVRRQAVSVRDASWRQDVDDLIRRLEGREAETSGGRRPWLIVGIAAGAIIAVVVAIVLLRSGDENDASDDGDAPPSCSTDSTFTDVELATERSASFLDEKGRALEAEIVGASTRPARPADADNGAVLVELSVANNAEPVPDTFLDDTYLGAGAIRSLLLDGVDQGAITCMSVVGDPEIEPTERAIATIGFDTTADPTGAPIRLVIYNGVELTVTE